MNSKLTELATLIRHHILTMTTAAGSGHPTSSLSATDLMTTLMFGGSFHYDIKNPNNPNNDRLIFSKGHASPLFYALWAVAGGIPTEELNTLRKFGSRLEGHPTMKLPFTEAATGSLGQGLSIGVGMAMNAKYLDKLPYKTYVLLGDSELAEGSNWEAFACAAHYNLDNLIAVLDVNRLGQRGETMSGHHLNVYKKKAEAFGWNAIVIDGHNIKKIKDAFVRAQKTKKQPTIIIAKTLKGKGISFIENKDHWHGKALNKEELEKALKELGPVTMKLRGKISAPRKQTPVSYVPIQKIEKIDGEPMSTRKAYGKALVTMHHTYPTIVVLDAETSNSTFAELFKHAYPNRFFEMYIAEQNMIGVALGLSRRGKIPFVSTFAAFLTRAFDQIRMSQYSNANIKMIGSHAGVSIGEDGASQMALEDIAMMRSIQSCVVLYPSDAIATEKLVDAAAAHQGNVYIRTTRMDTNILYTNKDTFKIGGSKTIRQSPEDIATIIGAGVTLHEALKAYEELKKYNIFVRVIDLYSIKPLDQKTLERAAKETKTILTVEDHYPEGGIGEAVASALAETGTKIVSLTVKKMPISGRSAELLEYEEINCAAIVKQIKKLF